MIEPSHMLKPIWHRQAHYGALAFAGLVFAASMIASEPARTNDLYRTEYDISIFGLSIAKSAIETTVNGANYNLNGRFLTSGLARVFDDTDGTVHVTGSAVSGKVVPKSFDLAYKHGRKNKSTTIRFANGNVVSAENQPPVKSAIPGWKRRRKIFSMSAIR